MTTEPPRLACDAMLGGLARWLRAAGHDATWHDGIPDGDLVQFCLSSGRVLLSSDEDFLGYNLVRDGQVRLLFIPRSAPIQEQLAHVLRELKLGRLPPRCMACGGELERLSRDDAAGLVPEKSRQAYEEFWRCLECAKAFWHGSHWQRIDQALAEVVAGLSHHPNEGV